LAAEAAEGSVHLKPSSERLATLLGVSIAYVNAARRLSNEERRAVERGERPLITPRSADAAIDAAIAAMVKRVGAERV
jgi:hypothetical protein